MPLNCFKNWFFNDQTGAEPSDENGGDVFFFFL